MHRVQGGAAPRRNPTSTCWIIIALFSLWAVLSAGAAFADSQSALEALEEKGIRFIPTEFIDAIQDGDSDRVKLFLEAGMSPDVHDTGNGALAAAAAGDHMEIVELLLAAGAHPDGPAPAYCPLARIAGMPREAAARRLLAAGASPDGRGALGRTALNWAAEEGQAGMAELLVSAGAGLDLGDEYGRTALMAACIHGRTEVVKLLLAAGAARDLQDHYGQTALSLAVGEERLDCVDLLLAAGARLDIAGSGGQTPLALALARGFEPVARRLVDAGADPLAGDRNGDTPLVAACRRGYPKVVRSMLDRVSPPPDQLSTALKAALDNQQVELFSILTAAGANPGGFDWRDKVCWAAARGNLEGVRAGIAVKDARWSPEYLAANALFVAAAAGKLQVLEYLLGQVKDIDITTGEGRRTPLHFAAAHGHPQTIRRLCARGASVDGKSNFSTPLLDAVQGGHLAAVRALLELGANPKATGPWTNPLLEAVRSGNRDLAAELLRHRADPNPDPVRDPVTAESGVLTPLRQAVRDADAAMVRLLLDGGARTDTDDNRRITPLVMALKAGNEELARMLAEAGQRTAEELDRMDLDLRIALDRGDRALALGLIRLGIIGETRMPRSYAVLMPTPTGPLPDDSERQKFTCLMEAANLRDVEMVDALIAAGADVNAESTFGGMRPLHFAVLVPCRDWDWPWPCVSGSGRLFEEHDLPRSAPDDARQLRVVRALLKAGADVNAFGEDFVPALALAVAEATPEMVKALLEAGADVNARTQYDQTALLAAAARGEPEIVKLLLAAGADPGITDTAGNTPLQMAEFLEQHEAARILLPVTPKAAPKEQPQEEAEPRWVDDVLVVEELLSETELAEWFSAIRVGDLKTNQAFVAKLRQAREEQEAGEPGEEGANASSLLASALREAARTGQLEIVRALLQAEAAQRSNEYEEDGTALHIAAAGGFTEIVRVLLEAGWAVDAPDRHGRTPLGQALTAEKCTPEIVRLLLEKGADPAKVVSEYGKTGFALWQRLSPECLQALLEARAVPAGLRDPAWGTPLLAACARRGAAVRVLLAAGADPGVRDLDGRTSLLEAARLGSVASMRALLAAGADPDATAMDGTTALLQGILATRQEVIPPLLAARADPNRPDRQGRTALMLGPKKEFAGGTDIVTEVIRPLLAAGADPNRPDRYGRTALMYAVGKKWDSSYREGIQPLGDKGNPDAGKLVDALLAAGARPNVADNDGRTALMYAAEACSVDATNSLIDAGASVHQQDKRGRCFVDIFNRSERWYQVQVVQHQEQRKAKAGGKQTN